MIVALAGQDFRTVNEFRRRHLGALSRLFGQVLRLCEKAGLVKLGHVALDGTKIKANASKHKAMSYERMRRREHELAAEDGAFGKDKSGEELPDWVADKERRLAKIREAKAALEAEAKAAAEDKSRAEAAAEGGLGGCRILLGGEPCGACGTQHRGLCRRRPGQARGRSQAAAPRPADPGDAAQAPPRRLAQPIPPQEADRRAGLRPDQGGARLQAVPVAWHRESQSRVGDDLHGTQPAQACSGCVMRGTQPEGSAAALASLLHPQ